MIEGELESSNRSSRASRQPGCLSQSFLCTSISRAPSSVRGLRFCLMTLQQFGYLHVLATQIRISRQLFVPL
jgi:hypothetical protein